MAKQTDGATAKKTGGLGKHIFSFVIMIVLTAAAFYVVANDVVQTHLILPLILVLALIQVFLQLFTFMHLDQKGSSFYSLFIFAGLLIAVVSAIGIVLM
jgi:heme/copper-type cytochrome/quinol oxidase subunit 4